MSLYEYYTGITLSCSEILHKIKLKYNDCIVKQDPNYTSEDSYIYFNVYESKEPEDPLFSLGFEKVKLF